MAVNPGTLAESAETDINRPTMRAARYHAAGAPFSIDRLPRPRPRPTDVIVEVKACGLVPNLTKILESTGTRSAIVRPELPAIYGLDPAGIVVETGELVHGFEVGDRVYVNPLRYCGSCEACRKDRTGACDYATLNGYFGVGPKADRMLRDYPYGGFGEYMTAPQYSLVKLPDNVPFETAARWGYMGTGYAALRRAKVDMSTTLLINGATGTLGLGATLFALALGVPKIFAVGRNQALLDRLKALAPDRIELIPSEAETTIADRVRAATNGVGVDVVLDALPTGASPDAFLAAFRALARGGTHVNTGGVFVDVPFNFIQLNNNSQTMIGSFWFSTLHGQEMASLAASRTVDLSVFDTEIFPLDQIDQALAKLSFSAGGFLNIVIAPDR